MVCAVLFKDSGRAATQLIYILFKKQTRHVCFFLVAFRLPNNLPQAGICFGCSMSCHADHEVYELFNKSDFRCDCGNSKFTGASVSKCGMEPKERDPTNSLNNYNHNFFGRYCYCDREYEEEQTMTQCFYCEDWFHDDCTVLGALDVSSWRSFFFHFF